MQRKKLKPPDKIIITAYHVVDGAPTYTVKVGCKSSKRAMNYTELCLVEGFHKVLTFYEPE